MIKQANFLPYLRGFPYHREQSGSVENLHRAVTNSISANHAAYKIWGFDQIRRHWRWVQEVCLRIGLDKITMARISDRLGEVSLLSSSGPEEAAAHLHKAIRLYEETGLMEEAAGVHARLAQILSITSSSIDLRRARQHSGDAVEILDQRPNDRSLAESYISQSVAPQATFLTQEGLAASTEAMKLATLIGDREMWCEAAALHGLFLWARGELGLADLLFDKAMERSRSALTPKAVLATVWTRGYCSLLLMDPNRARLEFSIGLRWETAAASPFMRQILEANCGIAHAVAGDLSQARDLVKVTKHRFLASIRK